MSAKRLVRSQIIISCLSTLAVIGVVILCYAAGSFSRFDNFFSDLRFNWRGTVTTSGNITLVLLDDRSAVALDKKKGGWSRRHMAAALNNLCRAGAEVVGIDLLYNRPDANPENDRLLAEAMDSCGNVVLARVSSAPGLSEINPLPLFQEVIIGDGFINLPLDPDDVLRKVRFLNAKTLPDGTFHLLPSFALEMSRTYLDLAYDFEFPKDAGYFLMGAPSARQIKLPHPSLQINYSGTYREFTHISFADAVLNSFRAGDIQGRLVLIGTSMQGDKDFFSTPFSRFRKIDASYEGKFGSVDKNVLGDKEPGVACHAHAVETILTGDYIRRPPRPLVLAIVFLLGLAGGLFYLPRLSLWLEASLMLGLMALILFSSYILFVTSNLQVDISAFLAVIFAQFVAGIVIQKTFSRKKSTLITNLFGKYVSSGVVDELIKGNISDALVGRRQNLTMLFSDLRGFTTLSEELGAKDTGQLLNIYFDTMLPIVLENKGTLDKLMGDAVMAFFGAPLPVPDHPARAADTALTMLDRLAGLKAGTTLAGIEKLAVGIGLNTGEVTVGNLGSNVFVDYTIIGDAVNLASRLEGLNKVYGTRIIASEFTAGELDDSFILRDLDIVQVKGKKKAVKIYELVGKKATVPARTLENISMFESALTFYRTARFEPATKLFRKILDSAPEDGPTRLYLGRIEVFRQNPPPEGWQGVTVFDHK